MKKSRVQLDFSQDAFNGLNELVERTGASSRAEIIRYALGFLKWACDKTEAGYKISAIKGKEAIEPVFPFYLSKPKEGVAKK